MKKTTKRELFIDGIQTGEKGIEANIAVIKVSQTEYGLRNNEVLIRGYAFNQAGYDEKIKAMKPYFIFALDDIAARRLISELAQAFRIELEVEQKNRTEIILDIDLRRKNKPVNLRPYRGAV